MLCFLVFASVLKIDLLEGKMTEINTYAKLCGSFRNGAQLLLPIFAKQSDIGKIEIGSVKSAIMQKIHQFDK